MMGQRFFLQNKKLLSIIVAASLMVIMALMILLSGLYNAKEVYAAAGDPITMVVYGDRIVPPNTEGDDWDTAWLANDKVYIQNDDGGGFNNPGHFGQHDRISELFGTPENPSSLPKSSIIRAVMECLIPVGAPSPRWFPFYILPRPAAQQVLCTIRCSKDIC